MARRNLAFNTRKIFYAWTHSTSLAISRYPNNHTTNSSMTLSDAEALDLLTKPKYLTQKAEALRWQNRVRFHGLTVRDKDASAHWPTYRQWVYGFLLVQDKRDMFDAIFAFLNCSRPSF